jgi:Tfp pilus assembly protein PilF
MTAAARKLVLVLATIVSCPAVAADSKWIRLQSSHFELYSSAGPRAARDTIREFEQVRTFFLKALNGSPAKPIPIRLVVFGSPKEYEPYRLNEFAVAYYHQTPDRDYIVLSRGGADIFPIAVHEYVHLLIRHSDLKLPPWLNEGMAELFSTLKPLADKVLVGDLIPGRMRALLDDKWVPLSTILGVDHNSPYYNEKQKAGNFYNESWALTHMLSFRQEYRAKFNEVVSSISAGKESAEALQQIYGVPLAQIEKDLQAYLRGTSFQGSLVATKFERSSETVPAEPLADFDSGLMLADLRYRPGREAEQKTNLEKLAASDPKRPEPYRGLAYLAWRKGDRAEAVQQFGKAYERGDHDAKLLWDYGRLLEHERGEEAAVVLKTLLDEEPDRVDVRVELAETQLRANDAKAALTTLSAVRKVTPELSTRFFRAAVYAHLRNGDQTNAEATAKRYREIAKTDEDKAEAEMLLRRTERRETVAPPPAQEEVATGGRPTLRRQDVAPTPEEPVIRRPERPTVSGRFVELRCEGPQARMVIDTGEGRRVFLIEDPTKIEIVAGASGPVEMTCGPQKNAAKVDVGFERPAAKIAGIEGVVKSLAF